METFANKTLVQIQESIEGVEKAREDVTLSAKEKAVIEALSVSLRKLERTVMRKKEQELLKTLTEDSKELNKLSKQLKESAGKLENISETVEKTSQVVGGLVRILAAALSSGLI